jgi:molecular chaperone HscB
MSTLNYFTLLELPVAADLDRSLLDKRYREQQSRWHPDRFVTASEGERKQALQRASLLNDAYETLKTPLRRIEHILAVSADVEQIKKQAKLPLSFLEQQLALRESLETLSESRNRQQLSRLQESVDQQRAEVWQQLRSELLHQDWCAAHVALQKLQFLHKLQEEVDHLEDRLLDA